MSLRSLPLPGPSLPAILSMMAVVGGCRHDVSTTSPASPPAHVQEDADAPAPATTPAEHDAAATEADAPTAPVREAAAANPDDAAIEPPPAAEPSAPPVAAPPALVELEGATLTVGGVEADGLELGELVCAIERAPLMGTLVLIGSLAKQDGAFDRCAPKGDAVIVHWAFDSKRARDIRVEGGGSSKVDACVAKAMAKVVGPFDARCGAVLRIGAKAGADAGVERLRAAADASGR